MTTLRWIGDLPPRLPGFDGLDRLDGIVKAIKAEVDTYLRAGVARLAGDSDAPRPNTVSDPADAWLAAAYAHRYGSIYWLSRQDARALRAFAVGHRSEIDDVGEYLDTTCAGNRLWNYAVTCFVRCPRRVRVVAERWVPPKGFQTLGADTLAVLSGDFVDTEAEFQHEQPLYDLHDLAHLAATELYPSLYRNFQHDSLGLLPRHLVDLVAAPDYRSPDPLQHSDGIVFSDLLSPLFASLYPQGMPDEVLVDCMAEATAEYLLGGTGLYCARVGVVVVPTRQVTPAELAVLVQNKAYEHPASEIEQLLFIRGGTDGNDSLAEYGAADRIVAAASLQKRTFHDARNTLKHRAHRQAYRVVVSRLLRDHDLRGPERQLAAWSLEHLEYADHARGVRRDLFRAAAGMLGHTERPGALEGLGVGR